jgi:hypothetical protein
MGLDGATAIDEDAGSGLDGLAVEEKEPRSEKR